MSRDGADAAQASALAVDQDLERAGVAGAQDQAGLLGHPVGLAGFRTRVNTTACSVA